MTVVGTWFDQDDLLPECTPVTPRRCGALPSQWHHGGESTDAIFPVQVCFYYDGQENRGGTARF
jgi:hypothetical protein